MEPRRTHAPEPPASTRTSATAVAPPSEAGGSPVSPVPGAAHPPREPEAAPAPPEPHAAPAPADTALDLSALRTLWPSVVDAIRGENAMVGALLGEARPTALGDEGLTVAFPPSAGFSKRKAEANRALVQDNLRRLTGRGLALRFELAEIAAESDLEPASAPVLSEDELLERLKQEFGAREIFDDENPARED